MKNNSNSNFILTLKTRINEKILSLNSDRSRTLKMFISFVMRYNLEFSYSDDNDQIICHYSAPQKYLAMTSQIVYDTHQLY